MTALIDTGFLYATLDQSDANHQRATDALADLTDDLLLPRDFLVIRPSHCSHFEILL
jgi:predicted nucleic acid-binding protein